VVTSAALRISHATNLSSNITRDMEVRGFDWSAGGLTTADWRTPANLAAHLLYAVVRGAQSGTAGRVSHAGSESLRALVAGGTSANFVVVSSRQRAGNVPTSDEGSSIYTSDNAGTSSDPCLVFTTFTRTAAAPGMEVQLSDGSWVFGVRPAGSATVTLIREDPAGTTQELVAVSLGTGITQWADVPAAQGMTLAVDAADNLYVVGRAGDAVNSIRHRAYVKAPGSWSWTAATIRTIPLPAHTAPANNFTATWHPTAGGTLVVFAAHAAGEGVATGSGSDLAYALIGTQYLLTGTGDHLRATGSAQAAGLVPTTPADFNGFTNETGSGLDVVADRTQPDWGYLATFKRAQGLGDNSPTVLGRYILLSTGAGFSHASYEEVGAYSRKDAAGKLRVLSVGSGQVALVTADADAGYGLTVQVHQASGATPGFVSLGSVYLAQEELAFMPDGPAVAPSLAWDAVYNVTENAVWVYYVNSANPANLRRTSVSLNTYQATRVDVGVYTLGGGSIVSVRAPRNSQVAQRGHVTVGISGGGTYTRVVDAFNQAPLAPTLTAKLNYDATTPGFFAWTFQDPNGGDTQSAYQLQVVRVSDSVTVLDTGKVASSSSTYTLPSGQLANGASYRWRVMTWDALDVAGPWSDYGTFSTSAGGSVNITAPAVDNPPGVITDDFQVAWSATGTVQASYWVWVTRGDTGATVFDSGWVASTATSVTVTGMVSDVEHTIRVQVRNASAVTSGVGTRLITPSYGTPEVPVVAVTPVPEGGHVLVAVDNPIPGEPSSGFPFWDMEGAPDLAAWYKNGGTLAASTAQVYRGAQSAAFVSTGSGVSHAYNRAPAVNVTPGQRYAVRAWLYADAARDVSLAIDWLTPGGAYVSGATTTLTLAAGTWTAVEVAGNCPATAGKASYGYGIRLTPAAGVTVWADDLRLAPASDRPDVARNRVLRRRAGSTGPWEVLGTCPPDGTFRDYTAPSQVPMEYMVRGETA
jgi:hypothetical protein